MMQSKFLYTFVSAFYMPPQPLFLPSPLFPPSLLLHFLYSHTHFRLMARLAAAGGEEYALVCALAYRQTLGMNKLAVTAPANGSLPVHFRRESGSGDDILTTDVIIDSAPFFLLFNTEWIYAQLRPIMDFDSGRCDYICA